MTRFATGDTIVQKPRTNVYTVLTLVATVAVLAGFIMMYMHGTTLFGDGWLTK